MKTVGTAELKAHLSAHLRAVRQGETITVLDRQQPIARIVPMENRSGELTSRPPVGALSDIPVPSPVRGSGDVLDDLQAERTERL
jgi:antitoxin (DNA-binding transcriptional repressor) of toxin-antitoxin stability system